MGAGGSNKTYFNMYQGKLVIEYDKKEDLLAKLGRMDQDPEPQGHHKGVEKRKRTKGKKEGKKVFYYVFNDVNGKLTNIELRDTDFGEFLNIELTDDEGEVCALSLGDVFGRYAKDFIRRIDGLNLKKEIAFGTWSMENDNGKTYSGVRMYQDGDKIDYEYQNADLPAPEEKGRGKKMTWDFSEQEKFLYDILTEFLKKNFKPVVDHNSEDPIPKVSKKSKKDKKGKDKKKVEKDPDKKSNKDKKGKNKKKVEKAPDKKSKSEVPDELPWDKEGN
jgi:hypothetical protein